MSKENLVIHGRKLLCCPKCKSPNVRWYEIYEQPMLWDQYPTRGIDSEGTETQAGDIIDVFCVHLLIMIELTQ